MFTAPASAASPGPRAGDPAARSKEEQEDVARISLRAAGAGGWAARHETADAALLWTQTPRKPNAEANGISGQQENSVSYCSLFLNFPELKV